MRHGFKVFTGAHSLGSYIRDDKSKLDWLKDCMKSWGRNIRVVTITAGKYSKETYAAGVCAIQSGWIFLQRMTKDMVQEFVGVVKALQEIFVRRLFLEIETSPSHCRNSQYVCGK